MIIIYWYITNSQNDQLPDGLIAQLIEHWTGIADVKIWHPSKVPFSRAFLKAYKECDMSLRDVQTIHVTNMLARDSVILLLSAIKMVNTDLFTSSLVHFRRPVKPKKCFMLSRIVMFVKEPSMCCSDRFISFGKHCKLNGGFWRRLFWTENRDNTPSTATGFTRWAYQHWVLFNRMLRTKICF